MRQCPQCGRTYSDDNQFCLEDGTPLTPVNSTPSGSYSGDTPTVAMPNISSPQVTASQTQTTGNAKWIYPVLGLLIGVIVILGFLVLYSREKNEKTETANQNVKAEQKPENINRVENAAKDPTPNNSVNQIVQPKINPNLTPSGNWSGDWNSKTTYFTAAANFTESDGQVTGHIVWTLQRTTNPKKIDKVGSSATEYIQGTYNPVTRTLLLKGSRLDDPYGIVVKDKYTLTLAENNKTLSGKSASNGILNLRR
jgi:hypothetical protein